ncbi:hypothetical protein ACFL6U_29955 [Planctomycetota bacterium]
MKQLRFARLQPDLLSLRKVVESGNEYEILAALNALEMLARDQIITVETIRALLKGLAFKDLHQKVMEGIGAIPSFCGLSQ